MSKIRYKTFESHLTKAGESSGAWTAIPSNEDALIRNLSFRTLKHIAMIQRDKWSDPLLAGYLDDMPGADLYEMIQGNCFAHSLMVIRLDILNPQVIRLVSKIRQIKQTLLKRADPEILSWLHPVVFDLQDTTYRFNGDQIGPVSMISMVDCPDFGVEKENELNACVHDNAVFRSLNRHIIEENWDLISNTLRLLSLVRSIADSIDADTSNKPALTADIYLDECAVFEQFMAWYGSMIVDELIPLCDSITKSMREGRGHQ